MPGEFAQIDSFAHIAFINQMLGPKEEGIILPIPDAAHVAVKQPPENIFLPSF